MKIRLKLDKEFHLIDPGFKLKRKRYFLQSFFASIALFFILLFEGSITDGAIIAGIAGTAALIFFAPHSYASETRRVMGGHSIAIVISVLASFIFGLIFPDTEAPLVFLYLYSSISLGLLIVFMGVLNCEHAPAAGCLLGLTLGGVTFGNASFVFLAALTLSIIRILMSKWITNLL
jgi:CBS-domain-containing membrane protein